ncbi:MAG: prepilin-type N-terminal cleavage/methylation domain-containing protein [Pseudobdellovibrio sp.]
MRNIRGMSLIEVIISAGVISIVALASVSLIEQQQKSIRTLSDKLTTIEVEKTLKNAFINDGFCKCYFKNKTLNVSSLNYRLNATDLSVPVGYTDTVACTPNSLKIVPNINEVLPNSKIKIKNIVVSPIQNQTGNLYTGQLTVEFDTGSKSIALNKVTTQVSMTIDPSLNTPSDRPIVGCATDGSAINIVNYGPIHAETWTRTTNMGNTHKFCGLREVHNRVCTECNGRHETNCYVYKDGAGNWILAAWRSDGSDRMRVWCSAYCF